MPASKTNPHGNPPVIDAIDIETFNNPVHRRAIRRLAARGTYRIVDPRDALLTDAPVTTNKSRSQAMAAAITAAARVRRGGSY